MAIKSRALPWVIVMDAMFTIFYGRRVRSDGKSVGISHTQTVAGVYRRHLHLTGRWQDISREIQRVRKIFPLDVRSRDYWIHVGSQVGVNLNPDLWSSVAKAGDAAEAVYVEIHQNPDLYQIPPEIRRMLNRLVKRRKDTEGRRPIRLVLGSNQEQAWLESLLEHHRLRGVFDAVYTSGGLEVRKPHPAFWCKIAQAEGVSASSLIHIGNSFLNDAPAVQVLCGEYPELLAGVGVLDLHATRRSVLNQPDVQARFQKEFANGRLCYFNSPRLLLSWLLAQVS